MCYHKRLNIIFIILLYLLILFLSCSPKIVQELSPSDLADKPIAFEASRDKASLPLWGDWDKVVREAKKEGKIFWYTTLGPENFNPIANGFTKSHGIAVERLAGPGQALVARITAEKRAGLNMADVFDGGTDPWAQLRDLNYVETILVPEAMDLSAWEKDPYYLDPQKKNILAYSVNTSGGPIHIHLTLVKPGEIKSWQDLLNPKWKGKIVMEDITKAGPGQAFFARSIVLGWTNENFWRKMAEQQIFFTTDRREVVARLARGQAAVALGASDIQASQFQEEGAPISPLWFKDMAWTEVKNVTLIKDAPNPNAARLFINWLMSKEGQEIMSRIMGRVSQRKDVSENLVPEKSRAPSGFKVHWTTLEELTAGMRPDILELAKFLTGK